MTPEPAVIPAPAMGGRSARASTGPRERGAVVEPMVQVNIFSKVQSRLVQPPGAGQGVDVPERTQRERALVTRVGTGICRMRWPGT